MTNQGKYLSLSLLTGIMVLAVSTVASADELEAQCKAGNPIDGADKICKCVSDKITGADRAAAIKAIKVTNEAISKGTAPDQSILTEEMAKAMTVVATAEAACMQ
jgi:hypothetical protein